MRSPGAELEPSDKADDAADAAFETNSEIPTFIVYFTSVNELSPEPIAIFSAEPMEDLFAKLQALRGATIDDATIAQLLASSASAVPESAAPSYAVEHHGGRMDGSHSVDDLLIASKAAEMELESMRRYFNTPAHGSRGGVDGLQDEDVSSDSDDDVLNECKAKELSVLDKLLTKNNFVTVADDEDEEPKEANEVDDVDVSHVPTSVVMPFGARMIPLGSVQSVVDGMLVIGDINLLDVKPDTTSCSAACEVESLVFLADSEPLTVVGMVVDVLGTVRSPIHLVLITNKQLVSQLGSASKLVASRVCTIDTHSKQVEIDEVNGQATIRGSPQILGLEDGDDDGADEDLSPKAPVEEVAQPLPTRQTPVYSAPRYPVYHSQPPPPPYGANQFQSYRR